MTCGVPQGALIGSLPSVAVVYERFVKLSTTTAPLRCTRKTLTGDHGATLKVCVRGEGGGGGGLTSDSEWGDENAFSQVTLYNFQKSEGGGG